MKYELRYIHASIIMSLPAYIRISLVKKLRLFTIVAVCTATITGLLANHAALTNNMVIDAPIHTVDALSSVIPEMRWVLLPGGTNGTCVSNTDCCENIFCYGLEYTPGSTGVLTSYTTAFFADCILNDSPILSNATCVMTDNSEEVNGCAEYDLIQIHCSGNTGTLVVTAGVPKIIHQVCFSVPPGMTINVAEDEVTDLTTSIDLTGGGFVTEYPVYETHTLVHSNIVTNTNNNGVGSLRHVVDCTSSGGTITFAPALTNQIINLTSGVIDIDKDLTVEGLGMVALVLSGNNSSVIFHLLPGYDLILKDLALKNASALSNGGAIFAEGNITLKNVLLQNNFENGVPKSMTITNTAVVEIIGVVDIK